MPSGIRVASKTNDDITGDGTTTATVLTQLSYVKESKNVTADCQQSAFVGGLRSSGCRSCRSLEKHNAIQLSTKKPSLRLLPYLLVLKRVGEYLWPWKKLVRMESSPLVTWETELEVDEECSLIAGYLSSQYMVTDSERRWWLTLIHISWLQTRRCNVQKITCHTSWHSPKTIVHSWCRMMWMAKLCQLLYWTRFVEPSTSLLSKLLALVTVAQTMLEDIAIFDRWNRLHLKDLGLELKDATIGKRLVKPLEWLWTKIVRLS